ncbi:3-isopropylmalate dehydratase small subunit [Sandaracinobacteroides saxicola]|uniref:3-isopropylmalate dehydratase small subunit n=1 Tax=Sandaracinobacteroides saxicola TaxID=2759707 RepID=A0A7G5IJR3_9SPHN|nr:3-isopropylmalate dehydratase small subunit [Sandaracinobacteroides saxicola]QMW23605.1 3-isopropylmalate dehydratase small subunit [Sandaracinobacteroides saxicola]
MPVAEPLVRLTAVAAPLLRDNIDTDIIIPSREMKTVGKTGLADGLFAGWRYQAPGSREPDPDFVLNQPAYRHARVLLTGANVGCGSSREHAAWALAEWGFRAVVAPSFNPIFLGNVVRNGIAPVKLPMEVVATLAGTVTLDLEAMTLTGPDGAVHRFALDAEARAMLLEGLDAIDLTLKLRPAIEAWREADRGQRPWVYG